MKELALFLSMLTAQTCPCPSPSIIPTVAPTPVPTVTPAVMDPWAEDDSCQGLNLKRWAQDANGWTILPAPERMVIVAKNPIQKPAGDVVVVSTPEAGVLSLRKGHADALLFNRGESFDVKQFFNSAFLGGADADHLMVIGAFGSGPRPKLMFRADFGMLNLINAGASHLALVSLDIQAVRSGTFNPDGIRIVSNGSQNLLIEDTRIQGFNNNLSIDAQGVGHQNLVIRRSQILDSYAMPNNQTPHSQGVYAANVHGLLIEESIFDHNGWLNRDKNPGIATIFNHNLYLQATNRCVTFRKGVVTNGDGLQMRSGGVVEDSFLGWNSVSLMYGSVNGDALKPGLQEIPPGVSGHVSRNVLMVGTDINAANPRNGYSEFASTKHAVIEDNIFAHHQSKDGMGLNLKASMGAGFHQTKIQRNIVYDQLEKITFSGPAWGPAILKADGQGVSLYSQANGAKWINWDQTGMLAKFAGTVFVDSGSILDGNIFQTGPSDFVQISTPPKQFMVLKNMQKAPVKFKDPSRIPSVAQISAIRNMDRSNWYQSQLAPALNAWVRDGFQIQP